MTRRPGVHGTPRSHVAPGGTWPAGPFAPATPPSVLYAATIAARLRTGLAAAGLSNSDAAERIGVARQTLQRILGGQAMPDLRSLAGAEALLGVRLTPEPRPMSAGGDG